MKLDGSCPHLRDMDFHQNERPEDVRRRILDACRCSANREIAAWIRKSGHLWLEVHLRPSGEKETEE